MSPEFFIVGVSGISGSYEIHCRFNARPSGKMVEA